jgi:hypothetical protein
MLSRTSRILLLAALLAAGLYLLLGRGGGDDVDGDAVLRPAGFDPSRLDGMVIERPGDTLRFELRGASWDLAAPVDDVAEQSAVASLLGAFATARISRNLGATGDGGVYGLEPPAARVVMTAGADTVARFDLGGYTADRAQVYGRAGGSSDVLLLPTALLRAASLPVDDYRNPRVASFDLGVAHAYRLQTTRGRVEWTRGRGQAWFTLAGADTIAGDSVAVEAVLRRARGLRVTAFIAPADTAGVFARADGALTIFRSDGTPPLTVRFARRPGGTFWARCDHETRVVAAEGDVPGILDQTLATLRDRRLVQFPPARAARIEITTPDTSGVLVRAGGVWAHPNPALGAIDGARAAALIRELRSLQWVEMAPPGEPLPSTPPTFSLVIAGEGGTILEETRAWRRAPGTPWLATSRSTPGACLVDAAAIESVAATLRRVRSGPTPR